MKKADRLKFNADPFQKADTEVTLTVPAIFSTSRDIESVLKFIARCKSLQAPYHKQLFFDLYEVEEINAGALSLLLSVTRDLETTNVYINGNVPKNEKAKQAFVDSGFLDYFRIVKGTVATSKNKILMKGSGQTDPEKTAYELKKAMETVFGYEAFNPPMQGAIIEMQANAVNHAFPNSETDNEFLNVIKENKPWYLSASHDYDNKIVYFSFIDNGVGVLTTLYKKFYQKVSDAVHTKEVLKKAFDGEYESATRLKERGRGLPRIKEAFDKKALKDLKIITNDYLYSFETQECVKLTNSFEGTFYIWKLDESCDYGNTKN